MKFLSIDQHISPISDLRRIFNDLGHTIHEYSLSERARVIGRVPADIPQLNGEGWRDVIKQKKFKEFCDFYAEDFASYDAIICCYPPIFSWLYSCCNKPILIHIPIRYEYGVDDNAVLWQEFNDYLRYGVDNGKIFLAANSLYDKHYTEGFLNRRVEHISSYCEYTGMSYNPVRQHFLTYSSFQVNDKSDLLYDKKLLQVGHEFQEVGNHKGIVHFPYQVSTMSMFEQYCANIPMFYPTKKYLLELYKEKHPVIQQASWNKTYGRANLKSIIPSTHEHDPNDYEDLPAITHWLQYADFYSEFSCANYFDNKDELRAYLTMPEDHLMFMSWRMREHNQARKELIYDKWRKLLEEVKHGLSS